MFSFGFFFVLTALVFVLTLIFTVNTCIVLFLQLRSHARLACRLKIFACSAPLLLAVSRGRLSWISFSFFLYFFLPCFFVGTRGYVRQRRVITLNNAARRVATGFCPNGRGLRCNRKAENTRRVTRRSMASRVRWVFPLRSRIRNKRYIIGDLRVRSAFDRASLISFRL